MDRIANDEGMGSGIMNDDIFDDMVRDHVSTIFIKKITEIFNHHARRKFRFTTEQIISLFIYAGIDHRKYFDGQS